MPTARLHVRHDDANGARRRRPPAKDRRGLWEKPPPDFPKPSRSGNPWRGSQAQRPGTLKGEIGRAVLATYDSLGGGSSGGPAVPRTRWSRWGTVATRGQRMSRVMVSGGGRAIPSAVH